MLGQRECCQRCQGAVRASDLFWPPIHLPTRPCAYPLPPVAPACLCTCQRCPHTAAAADEPCAAQTTNPPTLQLTRRRSPLTPSHRHPSLPPVFQTVLKHFPTALSVDDYITRVEIALAGYGFTGDNSIAMTNLCRDEVRRSGGTGAVPRCRRRRPCLALLMVAPCLLLAAVFLLQCMRCLLKLAMMLGRCQGSRGHTALGGVVGSREYCKYSLPARPCSLLGRQEVASCTALLLAAKLPAAASTTTRPSWPPLPLPTLPSHRSISLSLCPAQLSCPPSLVTPPPSRPAVLHDSGGQDRVGVRLLLLHARPGRHPDLRRDRHQGGPVPLPYPGRECMLLDVHCDAAPSAAVVLRTWCCACFIPCCL